MITPEPVVLPRSVIMSESLDPILTSFWEGFPCPPPWRSGLLHQLNFSGCVGSSIGNRIRLLMLRRCGGEIVEIMDTNSTNPLEYPEPKFIMEPCALNCKLLIISVCIVLFVGLLAGIIYLLYRNYNPKTLTGRSTGRTDTSKNFNSCHYASAPVIGPLDETSFCQRKDVCCHPYKVRHCAPQNRYDKLRFSSDKHCQVFPGVKDRLYHNYENDFDTSNDYESIDDIDKCDSRTENAWKFSRNYKFGEGETILSVSSDLDTDDNLCQVSMDNLHDEESFSSVACNEAYEPEISDDDVSHDLLADVNFDITGCNLTARVPEYIPTFSTFNKEVVFS